MATERIYHLRTESKPLSTAQTIMRGVRRVAAVAPWIAVNVLLPAMWGLVFAVLATATFDPSASIPIVLRLVTGASMVTMIVIALYLIGAEE